MDNKFGPVESFGHDATIVGLFEDAFGELIRGVDMESLAVEFVFGLLELEVDSVVILVDGFEEIIPVERLVLWV